MLLSSFSLQDVGPSPRLAVALAPRLNLFTGDNGLGKTFVLDVAWWALTRTWARQVAWPQRGAGKQPEVRYQLQRGPSPSKSDPKPVVSAFDYQRQGWRLPKGRPANPAGLIVYAHADGGFSVWDAARSASRDADDQDQLPTAFHFSARELWHGLHEGRGRIVVDHEKARREGPRVLCNGLIHDWVFWQKTGDVAFHTLREVLAALSSDPQAPLTPAEPFQVFANDDREMPTLAMPYGDVPLVHASAGIQRICGLAYLLVWAWRSHQRASALMNQEPTPQLVFLMDELEAHLHPRWQRVILPALLKGVERLLAGAGAPQVQLLVTTHAELVASSVEGIASDPSDALWRFALDQGQVQLDRLPWLRRGSASEWLTSEVFGLSSPRAVGAERVIEASKVAFQDPALTSAQFLAHYRALCEALPETDILLTRARFIGQQRGWLT